jgi:EmrB/QacA subfamily drug resistance transporter
MVFIDGTIANVALPALQAEFDAAASTVQWVIQSYALLLAALLLAGGAAGDRYGRRWILGLGAALFGMASLACGLVFSIEQLIVARAVQGVGGALLVPGSLAIITAAWPAADRGRAIGIWSAWSAVTAAIGPLAGGFLISHFSWRYAFLLNVPLAALVIWMLWRHVPESRGSEAAGSFDWVGAASGSLALGSLVYLLTAAQAYDWRSLPVLISLLLALTASAIFIWQERRHPAPMLPFWLFSSRDFTGANGLTLLLYAGLSGAFYFLPLNLIQVQGYSATAAGAATIPFVVIMFALSGTAGGLVSKLGARWLLTVGPTVAAAGFFAFSLPAVGGSYWTHWLPAVGLLGLGMTITVAPLTSTVMSAHGEEWAGTASGLNNAVSRVAAVLAIAVFGLVMSLGYNRALETELARSAWPAAEKTAVWNQRHLLGALAARSAQPEADGPGRKRAEEVRAMAATSFVQGFRHVMWLAAAMSLVAALVAWLMIGRGRPPQSDQ